MKHNRRNVEMTNRVRENIRPDKYKRNFQRTVYNVCNGLVGKEFSISEYGSDDGLLMFPLADEFENAHVKLIDKNKEKGEKLASDVQKYDLQNFQVVEGNMLNISDKSDITCYPYLVESLLQQESDVDVVAQKIADQTEMYAVVAFPIISCQEEKQLHLENKTFTDTNELMKSLLNHFTIFDTLTIRDKRITTQHIFVLAKKQE